MGRHSVNYRPDTQHETQPDFQADAEESISPPGGPLDPGVPSTPDAPMTPPPTSPEPSPNSPEITPSEPPPFAPDDAGDGSGAAPMWHPAGEQVL